MRRHTIVQLVAIAIALCFFVAAGALSRELSASAGRNKLVYTDQAEAGDPPQVGLGIAMGAFRGLFVNVLWIRANALKEAGKYYEAMTLSRAITQLQPRFPRVWVFHAWNMAYNISVSTQDRRERWEWVQKGIRLLRDEGIPANPNDLLIHRELGWIFVHKVAGYTDDANQFYKRELAAEWTEVLGEPPNPPFNATREQASEIFAAWLQPISSAPALLSELTRDRPDIRALVDRLRDEAGLGLDMELLTRWTIMEFLRSSAHDSPDLIAGFGPRSQALRTLMDDAALAEAWQSLLPFVRRKVLTEDYHMEPELMIRYTRRFGPMDWRHPAAHGLYWTARGVERARLRADANNIEDFDFLNTDRQVVQCVQEMYRSGDLFFSYLYHRVPELRIQRGGFAGFDTFYRGTPNVWFVDTYKEVIDEARPRGSLFESGERLFTLYAAGYENFMRDAIRFFYRRGQRDMAQKYHNELLTYDHININYYDKPLELGQDLESFVASMFQDERFKIPQVARSEIDAALQAAYIQGLIAGNIDLFRQNFRYAQAFHAAYSAEQVFQTNATGATGRNEVVSRDFRAEAGSAFALLLSTLDPSDAETLYNNAPNDLRQFGYYMLTDVMGVSEQLGAAFPGRDFEQVFPRPANMEEFYAYLERRSREAQELVPDADARAPRR